MTMHILIVGQTESGKSTVAKRLISDLRARYGMQCAILDPLLDKTYGGDYQTDDPVEFLDVVFRSHNLLVIIDEAGETVGHYQDNMFKLATRGRHMGHTCMFLAQRGNMVHPTVRNNCGAVYIFNQSAKDCKALADDFNEPKILQAVGFGAGEYIYKRRMQPAQKFKLF